MKRNAKASARSTGRNGGSPSSAAMGNPMAEQVGPEFHDLTGLGAALAPEGEEVLGAQQAQALVDSSGVLTVRAFDGTPMFPTWQVVDGQVLPGLPEVLRAMAGQPAWSVGLWLTTVSDELGRTPRAALEQGDDVDGVVSLAAETARRWS